MRNHYLIVYFQKIEYTVELEFESVGESHLISTSVHLVLAESCRRIMCRNIVTDALRDHFGRNALTA